MVEKKPESRIVTHPLDRAQSRQMQQTDAARGAARGAVGFVSTFFLLFGGLFTLIADMIIIPSAGWLFGLPFLLSGLVIAVVGLRLMLIGGKKRDKRAAEVERRPAPAVQPRISAPADETRDAHEHSYECEHSNELSPEKRLEQLERLYKAGLYTKEEYRQKRLEIMKSA